MSYESIDFRKKICEYIGTKRDLFGDGKTIYTITIENERKENVYIPIYMTEESKSDIVPPLPFIEFGLLYNSSIPHDIGASTRKHDSRIDVNIYWQKMDDIDQTDFGKAISDKICDLIRSNQCKILGQDTFINVSNTGRVFVERYGKQVVYHKNMEIRIIYYDRP